MYSDTAVIVIFKHPAENFFSISRIKITPSQAEYIFLHRDAVCKIIQR